MAQSVKWMDSKTHASGEINKLLKIYEIRGNYESWDIDEIPIELSLPQAWTATRKRFREAIKAQGFGDT